MFLCNASYSFFPVGSVDWNLYNNSPHLWYNRTKKVAVFFPSVHPSFSYFPNFIMYGRWRFVVYEGPYFSFFLRLMLASSSLRCIFSTRSSPSRPEFSSFFSIKSTRTCCSLNSSCYIKQAVMLRSTNTTLYWWLFTFWFIHITNSYSYCYSLSFFKFSYLLYIYRGLWLAFHNQFNIGCVYNDIIEIIYFSTYQCSNICIT